MMSSEGRQRNNMWKTPTFVQFGILEPMKYTILLTSSLGPYQYLYWAEFWALGSHSSLVERVVSLRGE